MARSAPKLVSEPHRAQETMAYGTVPPPPPFAVRSPHREGAATYLVLLRCAVARAHGVADADPIVDVARAMGRRAAAWKAPEVARCSRQLVALTHLYLDVQETGGDGLSVLAELVDAIAESLKLSEPPEEILQLAA